MSYANAVIFALLVFASVAEAQTITGIRQDPNGDQIVVISPSWITSTSNTALAELNQLRMQKGLFPLIEDPSLTRIARKKADIQALRQVMGHPGGSMGSAELEGVGRGAQFITCFQYDRKHVFAGAATVKGADGKKYHCLLLR